MADRSAPLARMPRRVAALALLLLGVVSAKPAAAADAPARSRQPDAVIGVTWVWPGTVTPVEEFRASGPLASTRMACPPGSQDAHYAAYVGRVTSFFLEGSRLYLELPIDSGTMRFRRADED